MSRSQTIKTERRRRQSSELSGHRRRLALDESKLDRGNYEYRWITDKPERVHALTAQDDWDIVSDRDGAVGKDGIGAEVSAQAGADGVGRPLRQVLVRKPKDLFREDYLAAQKHVDNLEEGLKRPTSVQSSYVPGSPEGASPVRMSVER